MVIQLQKLILIFMRVTALIVVCPAISYKGFPNTVKVAISFAFSFMIYTITPELEPVGEMLTFFMLSAIEVAFGLAIGYVTKLIFAIAEMAGQLIDFQVGFSMASVYDPTIGTNVSNYGRVYYWLSICIFFILDMHHRIIAAIIKSYEYVPLGQVSIQGSTVEAIVVQFAQVFELALNLAAPMIIVVLITDIVLGVISKTVPQINVLMLGMPLKSIVSFFITMVMLSWLMDTMGNTVSTIPGYMEAFMKLIAN